MNYIETFWDDVSNLTINPYNENILFDNYKISDKPQIVNYPSNYTSTWAI